MNLHFVNNTNLLQEKLNQSFVLCILNREWGEQINRESVSVPGVVLMLSCPHLDPTSPATEQQRSKHQCVRLKQTSLACRESVCVWDWLKHTSLLCSVCRSCAICLISSRNLLPMTWTFSLASRVSSPWSCSRICEEISCRELTSLSRDCKSCWTAYAQTKTLSTYL